MRTFPYNGFQYSREEILAWNPKRVIGYTYTKKVSNDKFGSNPSIPITKNEFDHAEIEFERIRQELFSNTPPI